MGALLGWDFILFLDGRIKIVMMMMMAGRWKLQLKGGLEPWWSMPDVLIDLNEREGLRRNPHQIRLLE
jgi:hypothetical protein